MSHIRKILPITDLAAKVGELKKKGRTVVLCHGVFDLMHPGHIKHLEAAKKEGDVLVVTLTPDKYVNKGPGRPVFNEVLRAETLASLTAVNYVAVNKWKTAVETIKTIRPSVYVKGSDYAAPEQDITGGILHEKDAIESVGGRLHFTDEVTFSSTALLNKFFGVFSDEAREFLGGFKKKYSVEEVIDGLKRLKKLKVLVIGDAIIDEYHYCKGMNKPPKDNIISTKFVSEERFAGGVLACANHIAGFCDKVDLVTCLGGVDTKEDYILEHLKPNIRHKFFYRNDTCTVVKRRFVDPVFLTKLFEVSFLEDYVLPESAINRVCRHLEASIGKYDLVLVSDFGHGFISGPITAALSKAKFLAVNAQTNSANMGYNLITKYGRADYLCIDEPEVRLAAHNKYGEINGIIKKVAGDLRSRRASITRGHLGSVTYDSKKGFFECPIFSSKVVDRVGAGDAYLSLTAPLAASGADMEMVGFVGNAVAAIKVGIVCNRSSIEPVELYKFITTLLK
ncbi:MAG: PfkB family carbohydrate kinase [Elusimicrobiales bacterium]|jgi:rfaE bifunctional protein nucleotidyltransferase chain/domain